MDYLRKNPAKVRNNDSLLEGEQNDTGRQFISLYTDVWLFTIIIYITTRGQMINRPF